MERKVLEWDSAFFGRRIAQATVQNVDGETLAALDTWCDEEAVECLYLLTGMDAATIVLVEQRGFGLKDVRVTLARELTEELSTASAPQSAHEIRSAEVADLPALEAIAARSHRDSRFYADERIGRAQADELFRTWIRNSVNGWADDVLVLARADGGPVGYITGHRRDPSGQIGLIAVAEEARGAGGARRLVSALCARHRAAGLTTMKVVTQARNLPAQRLYQRLGFTTQAMDLWYHRWWPR